LFIGVLTFLSNGEDYEDMVLFGKTHENFLMASRPMWKAAGKGRCFTRKEWICR
jgi:hypothetical protein